MFSGVEVLGVEIPYPSDVLSALGGRVSAFLDQYRQWRDQASPELAQMRTDLWVARSTFAEQGSSEVAQVDALAREIEEIQAEADTWGGTWSVLAEWLSSISSAVGLSAAPIAGAIGVSVAVSAFAALAYVLSRYFEVRQRAATVVDIANRLQAGTLTTGQAEVLLREQAPPPGILDGLKSFGSVGLLLAGVVVVVLLMRGR